MRSSRRALTYLAVWAFAICGCVSARRPVQPTQSATPGSPARERAEVLWIEAQDRFRSGDWSGAHKLADEAESAGLEPGRSRDLKAGALLMSGDALGALELWNGPTSPLLGQIDVVSERLPPAVVRERAGLWQGNSLSPGAYGKARRRLSGLPSARATRVRLYPRSDRAVDAELVVQERTALPRTMWAWGLRTALALYRERARLAWRISEQSAAVLEASARWQEGRTAWSLGYSSVDGAIPGRTDLTVSGAEEGYTASPASIAPGRLRRRGVHVGIGDWVGANSFLAGELGYDRWRGTRSEWALWIAGTGEVRLLRDRARLRVRATRSVGNLGPFETVTATAGLRSPDVREPSSRSLHLDLSYRWTSDLAPAFLWPGAGTGRGRHLLLRAHPLTDAGAVRLDRAFGKSLAHATAEVRSSGRWTRVGWISLAAFSDVAHASRRSAGLRHWSGWDVGAGLRIRTPFGLSIRVDASTGLLDGAKALSLGLLTTSWDPWARRTR